MQPEIQVQEPTSPPTYYTDSSADLSDETERTVTITPFNQEEGPSSRPLRRINTQLRVVLQDINEALDDLHIPEPGSNIVDDLTPIENVVHQETQETLGGNRY